MARILWLVPLLAAVAAPAADPARAKWISVADRLVAGQAESWAFDWGEGVQMSGLMRVHERTGDDRYADFVARWAGLHVPEGTEVLLGNSPDSKRGQASVRGTTRGYCGHWVSGTALALLHEARRRPEYLKTATEIAGYIRAGAQRGPEGELGHFIGNYQIWVDTLNMSCPLLSRLSAVENRPAWLEDAANQLLVAARHMQDEKTRLFYHMWDWQHDRRSPVQWGRGNGWVMMSVADTFEFLPKGHRLYAPLKRVAEDHARGLLAAQSPDGLWHTIINDPSSYPECSATAMIAYGLLKLARLGVLPSKYRDAALRAWVEVNRRWVEDGVVAGVSGGTAPSGPEHYLGRPQGTYPWGTGAYLLAGSEADRVRR